MNTVSATSRTIDLGVPVHYLEHGSGDETFVLVHGLGGSHLNWAPVIEPLTRRGRVLVPDLGGFGRTPRESSGASVDSNLSLLARFVRATVPDRRVVMLGNSMGGYLTMRMAADHASLVRAAVLVDPAAPIPLGTRPDPVVATLFGTYLIPGLAGWMLRRRAERVGQERMVREMMMMCTVDVNRIDPSVMKAHVELAHERIAMPWAIDAFLEGARSILRATFRANEYYRFVESVRTPTLLLHGARDRLVPVAAARALAKRRADWRYAEHHDLGHVPQLEAPDWVLEQVVPWLETVRDRDA